MAGKHITLSNISTRPQEDSGRAFDPYLIIRSQRGLVGSRADALLGLRAGEVATFAGPYVLGLTGPFEAEQFVLELWDNDRGDGTGDVLLGAATVNLDGREADGRGFMLLLAGGTVELDWRVKGRPAEKDEEDATSMPTLIGGRGPRAGGPLKLPEKVVPERSRGEGVRSRSGNSAPITRMVTISSVEVTKLFPFDVWFSAVDPYVLLTGLSTKAQVRWQTLADTTSPVWTASRLVEYDPEGYRVEIWDSDQITGDDLCGWAEVRLAPEVASLDVGLQLGWRWIGIPAGQLRLHYSFNAPISDDSEVDQKPVPVVRKEIRKMPLDEQRRFVTALRKLFENKNGPGTSEYFRIAGYHGWPSQYCHHAQETFPGWHRGYLLELERALMKADKELGNDGRIGLPYWDWTVEDIDGQYFPRIIREEFGTMPKDLLESGNTTNLNRFGYKYVRDDEELKARLRAAAVADQVDQCLSVAEHWMHASTRFASHGFSVESPHNSVHVAIGFPLSTVDYAAFHPIFFLHHAQVDRVYEKHLQLESPAECQAEFKQRQQMLSSRGEPNRYMEPLAPFQHPFKNRPLLCSDTFDTRSLGFVYDDLPSTPKMAMEDKPPTYAAFRNVPVSAVKTKSYVLHVFVLDKANAKSWAPPDVATSVELAGNENYAGSGSIFLGRTGVCSNCMDRKPFNVLVDVRKALTRLQLNRSSAVLRVMCEDELGNISPLESTPVPQPVLGGLHFDETEEPMAASATADKEVAALQGSLSRLGYYEGSFDGVYGPKTADAVTQFQGYVGLASDGNVGGDVKKWLNKKRMDTFSDKEQDSAKTRVDTYRFTEGSQVRYFVDVFPGYLNRASTLAEIDHAFAQWGSAIGIDFMRSEAALHAQLVIRFAALSEDEETLAVTAKDARLAPLAEATPQCITFDLAERWLLRHQEADPRYAKPVRLYPVLLHEVGHVLGLLHSSQPDDIMYPFYDGVAASRERLSANDVRRARLRIAPAAPEVPRRPASRLQDGVSVALAANANRDAACGPCCPQ
eukprot:TRINITY_DN6164_c0_g2_i1.p1 TRINITY_DN6164_c0_g2~~TRINITY_DN6164_c0_g2_i1.p1  ORF type:complete len:1025 (+),score=171.15 TRINITY_DN6164_c0_g2_i1:55-3129(+)